MIYASVDKTPEALRPASEALLHDIPFVGKDSVVVQEISYNEIIAKGSSVVDGIQSKQEQVENRLYNQGAGDIPKYVNLEPSLAMDWHEISWDELRIKERIGAGSFGTVYRAEWHGSPVASTINTLAGALYKVFCASPDPASIEMHRACFDYLSLGGVCSDGPIALLSGLNPHPLSLVLHFFRWLYTVLAAS